MTRAIVDATPLIALSVTGHLDLLPRLFDEVVVPAAVYAEVAKASNDLPGARELQTADWAQVRSPGSDAPIESTLLGLDPGEMQVLLLALEDRPDYVIIDERLGRRAAKALGLTVIGTVGLLVAAFRSQLMDRGEVTMAIEAMMGAGIRIGRPVLEWLDEQLG